VLPTDDLSDKNNVQVMYAIYRIQCAIGGCLFAAGHHCRVVGCAVLLAVVVVLALVMCLHELSLSAANICSLLMHKTDHYKLDVHIC
jgi:hypothetical protein